MRKVKDKMNSPFDLIKHTDENDKEYWSARDLQEAMGYKAWREFNDSIERAQMACENSGQPISSHFINVLMPVRVGRNLGTQRDIIDYHISAYGFLLTLLQLNRQKEEVVKALYYVALSLLDRGNVSYLVDSKMGVVFPDRMFITKEQKTIGEISLAFSHIRTIPQYIVGNYRIDLYFPDYNLAIECDEFDHQRYHQGVDEKRQSVIEMQLGCVFIRYNPDCPNFHIGDVINQIIQYIYC